MAKRRHETLLNDVTLEEGATTVECDNPSASHGSLWLTTADEGGTAVLKVEYRFLDGLANATDWVRVTDPVDVSSAETRLYGLIFGVSRKMEFRFTVSGSSTPTWDTTAVLELLED